MKLRGDGSEKAPRGARKPESCCDSGDCNTGIDRRGLFKLAGLGSAAMVGLGSPAPAARAPAAPAPAVTSKADLSGAAKRALADQSWPVLKHFDQNHLSHLALPLGGIGTGSVSLFGNGSLRDWEVMNRPAKGFTPTASDVEPFFALHVSDGDEAVTRVLEGPIAEENFEGSHGSTAANVNLPRFRNCEFAAGYPFGRVLLSDSDVPVDVEIKAFNPLVPADAEASGLPLAVLTYETHNKTSKPLTASVCGSLPNFVGMDGWASTRNWNGTPLPSGAKKGRNRFQTGGGARGIVMTSEGVDAKSDTFGSLALATTATEGVTHRTSWTAGRWGGPMLDFWDDFSADGALEDREAPDEDRPVGSVAVRFKLPAGAVRSVTFLIAWHFPNRYGWTLNPDEHKEDLWVGNHYCTQYKDAWDAVVKTVSRLPELTRRTAAFVRAFLYSSLPAVVKEAALFNVSTLRTQTCFRTADGRFYGWEGCGDHGGCCNGSCTHVWNYEQTTAFLFGELAMSMREVEFSHATDDKGVMSFRVRLPLATRAREFNRVAADGQMGCILKMYRDWQLSGDDDQLRALWPKVRKALEFCWVPGGWDGDRDGVMEGIQHNTMDVEYYGPNPQMEFWYLGALRAAEEMARYLGENRFAADCRSLYEKGSSWTDANLFNGEYYEHELRPVTDTSNIPSYFLIGMGSTDLASPDYQLASGCLVDQLVGQFQAHVCGLGYLAKRENIVATLKSILKYNHRDNLHAHFNPMRSFAIDGEAGLLMADYPNERPAKPFPYYGEVMTGFEYAAAVGMLYEGMEKEGLSSIRDVRDRYDGRKRSPYDEAECGHHYARAMAAWGAVLALTGFQYSAVEKTMTFAAKPGNHFWSNGYAWGRCTIDWNGKSASVRLTVGEGKLTLRRFRLGDSGEHIFESDRTLNGGEEIVFTVSA